MRCRMPAENNAAFSTPFLRSCHNMLGFFSPPHSLPMLRIAVESLASSLSSLSCTKRDNAKEQQQQQYLFLFPSFALSLSLSPSFQLISNKTKSKHNVKHTFKCI